MHRQWVIIFVAISGVMLLVNISVTLQWQWLTDAYPRRLDPAIYVLPNLVAALLGMLCARLWVTRNKLQSEIGLCEEKEADLKRRQREIELVNHDLKSFGRSLSHDLMGPVRVIRAYSEELSQALSSVDEDALDYLDRIRRSADRMDGIISSLMQLCGLRRGRIEPCQVDVSRLARQICCSLSEASPGNNVVVDIKADMIVLADIAMLDIALTNLLTNAWKFTRGRENPRISVLQDDKGVIEVSDNGVGFEQGQANEIFQAFTRCHSADQFEGTGIGLSIVKRVAERHGGRVWAHGRPREGASFFLELPCVQ